jgi:hypothetical protein
LIDAADFYFISDWGQKSPASFAAKLFQDYYDFTQNRTFLRNHAYPLAKLNAEFYLSYMTREPSFPQVCDGGCYNVMHSCAMVREAIHIITNAAHLAAAARQSSARQYAYTYRSGLIRFGLIELLD